MHTWLTFYYTGLNLTQDFANADTYANLSFYNFGARWGVVKATPRPLYPLERKPVPTYPQKVAYYYIKYLRGSYLSHVAAADVAAAH
jgi:hypothetical protein